MQGNDIYCSGICKMGAVRAPEVLLQPFLRWYQPSAEKLWHFENSRSLWKLVPTRSTSISHPPPNLLPLSALQTPVQFSPFTKPTLLQVKPLTFTITCTCLCLRGDNTRFFFFHSIAASWVAHAIKMSAVLKETTLYVNLTFLNIYMQGD